MYIKFSLYICLIQLKQLLIKKKDMYSLDCTYYKNEFSTIDDLLDSIKLEGMDPNYEITKNGRGIGDQAIELM